MVWYFTFALCLKNVFTRETCHSTATIFNCFKEVIPVSQHQNHWAILSFGIDIHLYVTQTLRSCLKSAQLVSPMNFWYYLHFKWKKQNIFVVYILHFSTERELRVVCYFPFYSVWSNENFKTSSVDAGLCTHIIFAFNNMTTNYNEYSLRGIVLGNVDIRFDC